MSEVYVLEPSPRSEKKWRITTPWGKKVDFGATGYSDYTLHKDPSRQDNYISRHASREDWTKDGTGTAGFWSRWILWNLPDLEESIRDTEARFNISIDTSALKTKGKSENKSTNQSGILPNSSAPMASLPPIIESPLSTLPSLSSNPFIPMSSLPPIVVSPMTSPKSYQTPISTQYSQSNAISLPTISSPTISLPTISSQPMASLPTFSNPPKNKPKNLSMDDYIQCKKDAADRRSKGKLKLCPEGYCTAKLTEDVYPSYWANLRASKICTGQEKDYEGNIKNYYNK